MVIKMNTQNVFSKTNWIIDAYTLKRIKFRAKRLAERLDLSDDQRDDYAQDMAVEILEAFKKFDASKSSKRMR